MSSATLDALHKTSDMQLYMHGFVKNEILKQVPFNWQIQWIGV